MAIEVRLSRSFPKYGSALYAKRHLAFAFVTVGMMCSSPVLAEEAPASTTLPTPKPSATADWSQKYGDADSESPPPRPANAAPAWPPQTAAPSALPHYGGSRLAGSNNSNRDDEPASLVYLPPSVLLSVGLVTVDGVGKNVMLGATAKAQVAAISRTRVGVIVVGLGSTDGLPQPSEDIKNASRIGFGALVSQSLYLTRSLDLAGFVGIGLENYRYTTPYTPPVSGNVTPPPNTLGYASPPDPTTSIYGLWVYPGLSLDIMYRSNGFQLGGGPFFAVPYHGIQKDFGGSFGFQAFVGF